MKLDFEKITATVKDLGSQRKASKILIFRLPPTSPGGSFGVHGIYVDDIKVMPEAGIVVGVREEGDDVTAVVSFPKDYIWYLVDVSEMEFFTLGEYYETERANVQQRVQTEKSLKAVYDAAKDGDYEELNRHQQDLFGKGYE